MSESRKFVIKQTLLVLAGVMVCVALMVGIYAMIGKFDMSVLLGGIVGGVLSTANFFFMAMSADLAADKAEHEDVKGGEALMKSSYFIRLAALALLLFACAKSGWFNLLALALPLAFVRPVLTVTEFFRKPGETKK